MLEQLASILGKANTALEENQLAYLLPLESEMRRWSVGLISVQSELAAKLHQRAAEFPEEIRELGKDALEIFEDLEELSKEFTETLQIKDFEEFEDVLEDLVDCLGDLQQTLPKLEQQIAAHDQSRVKLDDEFYLS